MSRMHGQADTEFCRLRIDQCDKVQFSFARRIQRYGAALR